jgi:hypothetical protein
MWQFEERRPMNWKNSLRQSSNGIASVCSLRVRLRGRGKANFRKGSVRERKLYGKKEGGKCKKENNKN